MTEGLEERKNELFATITLLAGVKRDIAAAQRDGRDSLALYDRQAQLEADKERLSHEVNSEYMYRNLQAFMNRVDDYDAARKKEAVGILAVVEDTASGLKKLGLQVGEISEALKLTIGRVSNVEEVVDGHRSTLESHGIHIGELRTDVDTLQTEITTLQTGLRDIRSKLAQLEADHEMFRKVLEAHPQPEALKHAG